MKITVLSENYVSKKGLKGEHGLSLFIETIHKNILFDMGQGDTFFKNAVSLGVDISKVDVAVLSHGHYDHGGGIETFLKENDKANIYINKNAFNKFYSKNGYIGLDERFRKNKNIVCTEGETEIFSCGKLVSADRINLEYPNFSNGLEKEISGKRETDDFLHEQYLQIEENGKTYLFSGCSHRGILNIVDYFKPDVFVGGFHLVGLDECSSDLEYVSEKLSEYDTKYYTCHCTGIEQYGVLKHNLKNKVKYVNCGCCICD